MQFTWHALYEVSRQIFSILERNAFSKIFHWKVLPMSRALCNWWSEEKRCPSLPPAHSSMGCIPSANCFRTKYFLFSWQSFKFVRNWFLFAGEILNRNVSFFGQSCIFYYEISCSNSGLFLSPDKNIFSIQIHIKRDLFHLNKYFFLEYISWINYTHLKDLKWFS